MQAIVPSQQLYFNPVYKDWAATNPKNIQLNHLQDLQFMVFSRRKTDSRDRQKAQNLRLRAQ